MRWIRPTAITTDPDLAGVFPMRAADRAAVVASMRERGYDPAEPLVVWDGHGLVVDGHTRLAAAREAGLARVYVDARVFGDKRDALEYAIRRQRDRRNLSPQELGAFVARAVETLDRVKPEGGKARQLLASGEASRGKSAAETAAALGVSRAQIERTRAVLRSDNAEKKAQLRAGQTTVNGAYTAVQEAKRAQAAAAVPESASTVKASYTVAEWLALSPDERAARIALGRQHPTGGFNRTNENIDWAPFSLNVVTGCEHDCDYCYARDIADRFYPQKFIPTFFPDRLAAPQHMRVPTQAAEDVGWRNVFADSMADLFGKWVPQDWIDAVLAMVRDAPQWNFLFLTKFPQRLAEQDWPENAWVGTSVDRQARVATAERAFRTVTAGVKWLSCEPLLERLTFSDLSMFDWVVIGASSRSSQTPEFQPHWRWAEDLIQQARAAGCKVYLKPNLKSRPQEYPGQP
jgi:protein gp37/ParB-like chromosome segregation protein Spo0J